MGLTLEQIAGGTEPKKKGLSLAEITGAPAAPKPKPTIGDATASALNDAKKAGGYFVDLAKRVWGEFGKAGENIVKDVQEQGKAYDEATSRGDAVSVLVEAPAILGRGLARATGETAKAAFSPITLPLADFIGYSSEKISDVPAVQRVAMSDSVGNILKTVDDTGLKLEEIAKKHPELAKDVDAVSSILLSVVGEEGVVRAGSQAVKTGKRAVEAAAKVAEKTDARLGGAAARSAAEANALRAEKEAAEILTTTKPPKEGTYLPETAATFEKYGIEPPVSAVTTSRAVQAGEAAAQSTVFGSKLTATIEKARDGIAKVAATLRRDVDPEKLRVGGVSEESAGNAMVKAVDDARAKFEEAKTALYDEATGQIGKQQAIFDETRKTLAEIIAQKKASANPADKAASKFYQNFLNNTRTADKRTFENIKQTRTSVGKQLGNRTDPITTGDKANLERLYAALSRDLDATVAKSGPEAAAALARANAYYKAGITAINGQVGRTIMNAKSPELLVGKLVKAGDGSTMRETRALVGEEAWKQVGSAFMNKIVDQVVNPLTQKINPMKLATLMAKYGDDMIRELVGARGLAQLKALRQASIVDDILERGMADGKVQPGRLTAAIERYDEAVLKEAFGEDDLARLMDVKRMADAMARGTKMADGSPTAEKIISGLRASAGGGGVVLAPFTGGASLLIPLATIATEWGLSKAFTSGALKRYLAKRPAAKESGVSRGTEKAEEEVFRASTREEAPRAPKQAQARPEPGRVSRYTGKGQ